jgi:hypothetical protein
MSSLIDKPNKSKEDSSLKYTNKLTNDLTNLLKNGFNLYDVEIKVGINDVKTFKVHSIILKTRSSYFNVAFSNNWIRKSEDGMILFNKENVSPKIFEVLLT